MKAGDAVTLESGNKKIQIFCSKKKAPLIIYHAVMGEGKRLRQVCRNIDCPVIFIVLWMQTIPICC